MDVSVCAQLSSQILLASKETREDLIRAELVRNPEIECIYSLNPQGVQITETFQGPLIREEGSPLFHPAVIGADHSLKPYCVPIIAGAHHYISEPYLSWASKYLRDGMFESPQYNGPLFALC